MNNKIVTLPGNKRKNLILADMLIHHRHRTRSKSISKFGSYSRQFDLEAVGLTFFVFYELKQTDNLHHLICQ